MQTPNTPQSRVRRTVNDLVLAEMFLVGATIESAVIIGDGFQELGKKISHSEGVSEASWQSISTTLQRIADDALEPYSSRFKYFQTMISKDS